MNSPKSNVLRLLEGDRGHRTKEQKAKDYFPVPLHPPSRPRNITKEARRYWNKYVKVYRITEGDVGLFKYLCELQDEIESLKQEIADTCTCGHRKRDHGNGPCQVEGIENLPEKKCDCKGFRTGRTFLKISVDGAGIEHQEPKTHPLVTQLANARKEKRILERDFSRRYIPPIKKEPMEDMIV